MCTRLHEFSLTHTNCHAYDTRAERVLNACNVELVAGLYRSTVGIPYYHCSSYSIIVQWVDARTKAQKEAERIKSELDAVQKQVESNKVKYTFVLNIMYRFAPEPILIITSFELKSKDTI